MKMAVVTQFAFKSGGPTWVTQFLSLCLVAVLLAFCMRRIRLMRRLKKIPSPFALPLIGNAYQLHCELEVFFEKLVKWSKEFNDFFLVWVGLRPFLFISREEQVKPLLKSRTHIDKSLEYEYLRPWLGTGLLTSNGEKWQFRRKLLTNSFHNDLMQEYFRMTVKEANIMICCLYKEVGKPNFDIVPYAKRAALDVICNTAMGYPINAQTNREDDYVLAIESLQKIMQLRFTNIWTKLDPIFKLTASGKEQDRLIKIIHSFVDKVIFERRLERAQEVDRNLNRRRRRVALLDLLLNLNHGGIYLTDEDLREEVNTFMFTGHDTVATSVSWLLYALGRKPEYQTIIINEYEKIVGDKELTMDLISELKWLEACLKESLRIYPVAPIIARQLYEDLEFPNILIPAGTTVLVNLFLLHRDPRNFPDPDVFRPERFMTNDNKVGAFAYVPFSGGSRNCIGTRFAKMEVKVTILAILRIFEIHSIQKESQLKFVANLVLDNVGGIPLRLKLRKSS